MIAMLPVIHRQYHILFVAFKCRFDTLDAGFQIFLRLPLEFLPLFCNCVKRQTEQCHRSAYTHDGKAGIFKYQLYKHKNKLYDLYKRINNNVKEDRTHTRIIFCMEYFINMIVNNCKKVFIDSTVTYCADYVFLLQ